ncbi:MAG: phasin family protein [Pseudomonadota bacterium]
MAEKKTTTKKATAKKAAPKKAKAKVEAAPEKDVESILERIQAGFKEAGQALAESGAIMGDKRREVLVTLIENAQENTDATFEALRDVMEADTVSESLRIQRDALREGIERNVAQVRHVASMTAESGRETIEPVAEYVSTLREKVKSGAAA